MKLVYNQAHNGVRPLPLLPAESLDTSTFLALLRQAVGNCSVADHDATRYFSYPNDEAVPFVNWLLAHEASVAAGLRLEAKLPSFQVSMWDEVATLPDVSPEPQIIRLQGLNPAEILAHHQRFYQESYALLPGFMGTPATPISEFFVDLELHRHSRQLPVRPGPMGNTSDNGRDAATPEPLAFNDLFNERGLTILAGPAGAGKTAVGRMAAWYWAAGRILSTVDRVIYLPLRDLKQRKVPAIPNAKQELTLWTAELLGFACLTPEEITAFQHYLFTGTTLWFADGDDEVHTGLTPGQQAIYHYLLAQPGVAQRKVIVGTRPHCLERLKDTHGLNRHVTITGFNNSQLRDFVSAHVKNQERDDTQVQQLMRFFADNPEALALARYPINAKLICLAFVRNTLNVTASTVSMLYQNMAQAVCRYYLEKYAGLPPTVPVTDTDIQRDPRLPILLGLLQQLAYATTADDLQYIAWPVLIAKTTLTVQKIADEVRLLTAEIAGLQAKITARTATPADTARLPLAEQQLKKLNTIATLSAEDWISSLIELGFVSAIHGGTRQPAGEVSVEFVHLSMQEYYTALEVYKRLQEAVATHDTAFPIWFKQYKLEPRYQFVWRFVSGLITTSTVTDYWLELLMDAPWSIAPPQAELERLAQNLTEVGDLNLLSKRTALITSLKTAAMQYYPFDLNGCQSQELREATLKCLKALRLTDKPLRDQLVQLMDNQDQTICSIAIQTVAQLSFYDEGICQALLVRLSDGQNSTRGCAVNALIALNCQNSNVRDGLLNALTRSKDENFTITIMHALGILNFHDAIVCEQLFKMLATNNIKLIECAAAILISFNFKEEVLDILLTKTRPLIRNFMGALFFALDRPWDVFIRHEPLFVVNDTTYDQLRAKVIQLLGFMGYRDEKIRAGLLERLTDYHGLIAVAAVSALIQLGFRDDVIPWLQTEVTMGPSLVLKWFAANYLRQLGCKEADLHQLGFRMAAIRDDCLTQLKSRDENTIAFGIKRLLQMGIGDTVVRDALLERLNNVKIKSPGAFEPALIGSIVPFSSCRDYPVRDAVAEALKQLNLKDNVVTSALLTMLNNRDPEARLTAMIILQKLELNDTDVLNALCGLLNTTDLGLKIAVINYLGDLGVPHAQVRDALLALLDTETDPNISYALAKALGCCEITDDVRNRVITLLMNHPYDNLSLHSSEVMTLIKSLQHPAMPKDQIRDWLINLARNASRAGRAAGEFVHSHIWLRREFVVTALSHLNLKDDRVKALLLALLAPKLYENLSWWVNIPARSTQTTVIKALVQLNFTDNAVRDLLLQISFTKDESTVRQTAINALIQMHLDTITNWTDYDQLTLSNKNLILPHIVLLPRPLTALPAVATVIAPGPVLPARETVVDDGDTKTAEANPTGIALTIGVDAIGANHPTIRAAGQALSDRQAPPIT